jgi:hypothetical protein
MKPIHSSYRHKPYYEQNPTCISFRLSKKIPVSAAAQLHGYGISEFRLTGSISSDSRKLPILRLGPATDGIPALFKYYTIDLVNSALRSGSYRPAAQQIERFDYFLSIDLEMHIESFYR